jgi:hypothetical protein
MANIAELTELASFLQVDLDTATANLLLLDLAQGLITEVIGEQSPWPSIAKSIALTAAGRAYRNPDGLRQESVGATTSIFNDPLYTMGVYLTADERAALSKWHNGPGGSTVGQPQGVFPDSHAWPDPVEWSY